MTARTVTEGPSAKIVKLKDKFPLAVALAFAQKAPGWTDRVRFTTFVKHVISWENISKFANVLTSRLMPGENPLSEEARETAGPERKSVAVRQVESRSSHQCRGMTND